MTQGAVDAGQRHHVADGGECDEVEQPAQVGFGARARSARRGGAGGASRTAVRNATVAAQSMAEPLSSSRPVGVHHGGDRRQGALRLVMVEHHDIGVAERAASAACAAAMPQSTLDDQRGAPRAERRDRRSRCGP